MNTIEENISFVYSAERLAEKLANKNKGNLAAVKKEIARMKNLPTSTRGFNFKKEAMWAATWIAKTERR